MRTDARRTGEHWCAPRCQSQNMTFKSSEPDSRVPPSGEKACAAAQLGISARQSMEHR